MLRSAGHPRKGLRREKHSPTPARSVRPGSRRRHAQAVCRNIDRAHCHIAGNVQPTQPVRALDVAGDRTHGRPATLPRHYRFPSSALSEGLQKPDSTASGVPSRHVLTSLFERCWSRLIVHSVPRKNGSNPQGSINGLNRSQRQPSCPIFPKLALYDNASYLQLLLLYPSCSGGEMIDSILAPARLPSLATTF